MVLKVLLKFYLHPIFQELNLELGSEFSKGRQSDYVLGNWSDEEQGSFTRKNRFCC